MISLFGGKSLRRAASTIALVSTLIIAPIMVATQCKAESDNSISTVTLDKHARKIHREFTHFKAGNYVHLVFRDGSERTVALESIDDSAFTATNAETNKAETHTYEEIARVTHEKYYIGEGSEHHMRHIPVWVPVTLAVVAAGAAVTVAEVH